MTLSVPKKIYIVILYPQQLFSGFRPWIAELETETIEGHFNLGLFYHELFNHMVQKLVDEKFMVEKSGGWNVISLEG